MDNLKDREVRVPETTGKELAELPDDSGKYSYPMELPDDSGENNLKSPNLGRCHYLPVPMRYRNRDGSKMGVAAIGMSEDMWKRTNMKIKRYTICRQIGHRS